MSVYKRLNDLHISLPKATPAAGAYLPFLRAGNLVFLSGHIAKKDGKSWVGRLERV